MLHLIVVHFFKIQQKIVDARGLAKRKYFELTLELDLSFQGTIECMNAIMDAKCVKLCLGLQSIFLLQILIWVQISWLELNPSMNYVLMSLKCIKKKFNTLSFKK